MRRVRLGWAIAAALLLAAVLGWRWYLRAAPAQSAIAAVIPAVTSSTAPEFLATPLPAASRPAGTASSPAQITDAMWCSEPPDPEDPEPDEATAASAPAITSPAALLKKMRAKPAYRKFSDAVDQVHADWARDLAALGGERALAASDFLAAPAFLQGDTQAAALDRLVARARVTQDGFVYALALQRCNMAGRPAVCEGISARQWARIDPGNLQPWLLEAGLAQAAKDPQALREAIFQIANSKRSQPYTEEINALLLALPASDQPGLAMAAQTSVLASVTFSWSIPQFSPLTRWCSTAAQDANRAQTCGQMAEKLWAGANTAIDALIAANLAKRLPEGGGGVWLKRQLTLDAARAWMNADMAARIQEMDRAPPGAVNNCTHLLRDGKIVQQNAAMGEWRSVLARLKQAAPNEVQQAALAAEWRAEQLRQKEQQQAQAQAASAPPVTKP